VAAVETWLVTLIVVVVVAAVLVAVTVARRGRRRQQSETIGLPPLGAVGGDGPAAVEPEPVDDQDAPGPRRAATDRPLP